MASKTPSKEPAAADGETLVVRAVSANGRRRAGFAFSSEPTELAVADLSEDQLEQILGDAQLSVTRV